MGLNITLLHRNGASVIFFIYFHIGRNLFYLRSNLLEPWRIGVSIYLVFMITAFLGYVLPWGQISYWGATVITNLLTVIPFVGITLLHGIWGAFSVTSTTLTRFFTLHYFLSFLLLVLIILHMRSLHIHFSSSLIGTKLRLDKIKIKSSYLIKDLWYLNLTLFLLLARICWDPCLW